MTNKFKDLIDELDPGIHQFYPFQMLHGKTQEPLEGLTFYWFVCGRLVKVQKHAERILCETTTRTLFPESEGKYIRTIQESDEAFDFLQNIPVWRLLDYSHSYYFSEEIVKTANKIPLKGFKQSTKNIEREITHVRRNANT